jgi:hypothetical protein
MHRFVHLLNSDTRKDSQRLSGLSPQRISLLWHCLQDQTKLYAPDLGPCDILARNEPLPFLSNVHFATFHQELASWPDEAHIVPHSASRRPNPSMCR